MPRRVAEPPRGDARQDGGRAQADRVTKEPAPRGPLNLPLGTFHQPGRDRLQLLDGLTEQLVHALLFAHGLEALRASVQVGGERGPLLVG
jgi:hypothetical protein